MRTPTLIPDRLPVSPATAIIAYSPLVFDVPGRAAPMEVRVTAPAEGTNLPIILFSHGHGASNYLSSIRGYGPLVEFYGAHGFVVIQVTHLDSKTLALDASGPEGALFWRSRAKDFHFVLDHLEDIERGVPFLSGRLDKERVAAIGHSLGGLTVSMLAGLRITDTRTGEVVDLKEPRLQAAVVLGAPGDGKDAAPWLRGNYPEIVGTDFSTMTLPTLVVHGDKDFHPNFSERKTWRADAYNLSPGPKALLTFFGAGHLFGGISGWDALETSDENPRLVADVQRFTWAYLRSMMCDGDGAWDAVKQELQTSLDPVARIEVRQEISSRTSSS